MRMSAGAATAFSCALLAACGGGSPNQVSGSYKGQSIDVADAILMPVRGSNGTAFSVVVFSSHSDACGFLQAQAANNSRFVGLALGIAAPGGLIVPPDSAGSYDVAAGPVQAGTKLASIQFAVVGSCGPGTTGTAVSGQVHVTSIKMSGAEVQALAGTFDATFDTGDKLSGRFEVSQCSGARIIFGVCP